MNRLMCFLFGHKESDLLYFLNEGNVAVKHYFCDRCNTTHDKFEALGVE